MYVFSNRQPCRNVRFILAGIGLAGTAIMLGTALSCRICPTPERCKRLSAKQAPRRHPGLIQISWHLKARFNQEGQPVIGFWETISTWGSKEITNDLYITTTIRPWFSPYTATIRQLYGHDMSTIWLRYGQNSKKTKVYIFIITMIWNQFKNYHQ